MALPGFSAEASFYSSGLQYLSAAVAQGTYIESSLRLAADSCVCTSPNCTWSCPVPPPHRGCTATSCGPGLVCCNCVDPPVCTTGERCKVLCTL
jgi:hypothetical protein